MSTIAIDVHDVTCDLVSGWIAAYNTKYGKALKLEEYRDNGQAHRRITSDKALCKGCGLCEATCPKEGVVIHHFTMDQLRAQVDAVIESLH